LEQNKEKRFRNKGIKRSMGSEW